MTPRVDAKGQDANEPRGVAGTALVKDKPAKPWRYALLPLMALVYPSWWLFRGGGTDLGLAAAAAGVGICGVGTLIAWRLRDRWIHEVHVQLAIACTTVVAGVMMPTFLITGWLPSRRPYRRPDLHVETWADRLPQALAITSALFALFWFSTSPRRGGGWLQKLLAKQRGYRMCRRCGMAIYYEPDHPCFFCGAVP